MNGLLPFERIIEQTTETMHPSHKTITAATMIKQEQLTAAATLLINLLRKETQNLSSDLRI